MTEILVLGPESGTYYSEPVQQDDRVVIDQDVLDRHPGWGKPDQVIVNPYEIIEESNVMAIKVGETTRILSTKTYESSKLTLGEVHIIGRVIRAIWEM